MQSISAVKVINRINELFTNQFLIKTTPRQIGNSINRLVESFHGGDRIDVKKATRESPFLFDANCLFASLFADRLQGTQLGRGFCQLDGCTLEIDLGGLISKLLLRMLLGFQRCGFIHITGT